MDGSKVKKIVPKKYVPQNYDDAIYSHTPEPIWNMSGSQRKPELIWSTALNRTLSEAVWKRSVKKRRPTTSWHTSEKKESEIIKSVTRSELKGNMETQKKNPECMEKITFSLSVSSLNDIFMKIPSGPSSQIQYYIPASMFPSENLQSPVFVESTIITPDLDNDNNDRTETECIVMKAASTITSEVLATPSSDMAPIRNQLRFSSWFQMKENISNAARSIWTHFHCTSPLKKCFFK